MVVLLERALSRAVTPCVRGPDVMSYMRACGSVKGVGHKYNGSSFTTMNQLVARHTRVVFSHC